MDLGAEKNPDPTVIVVDQLGSGFLTQTQKIREAVNLRIKVRRRDDGVDPGGLRETELLERCFDPVAPVIRTGEDMRMEINLAECLLTVRYRCG